MPSLKDIRKRISSVKNTQKITRALKLVSAAKLNRSQREMNRLKPYADKQQSLVHDLLDELGDQPSPLFEAKAEVKRVAALVMCSDRGMCGGFNSNLLKSLARYADARAKEGVEVACFTLGRRATQYVKKQGYELVENYGEILAPDLMDRVDEIAQSFVAAFMDDTFDEVVIISNRFINAITQEASVQAFLPIVALPQKEDKAQAGVKMERLYEPSQQTLLNFILPRALETQLRQAILESITGEHAARMNAMNNATDNASDMINTLTLQRNRARQAAITAELMEIISGAEALK